MGVLRLGDAAYGAAIRQEIHARSGRDVSISAVYTTLDRLEAKGFLSSWIGAPTAQRGGRRRKFYALRPAGHGGAPAGLPGDHGDGRRARSPPGDRMSAPLPAWIVWLLSRRLSDAWREVVLGDLAEEYEARPRPRRQPPVAGCGGRRRAAWCRRRRIERRRPCRRCPWRNTRCCRRSPPMSAMPSASSGGRRRSRSPWWRCSPSASAPRPRSSASSTPCCCGRCRSTSPIGWCGCSTCRRRPPSPASRASRCRRPTSTTGSGRRRPSRAWRCTAAARSR